MNAVRLPSVRPAHRTPRRHLAAFSISLVVAMHLAFPLQLLAVIATTVVPP